jgi:hypothetical protein
LTDPWAERRFVVCMRSDGSLSATTRLLAEYLHRCAGHDAPGAKRSTLSTSRRAEEPDPAR